MKIMICGSMAFAKEMMIAKKKLEKLGHFVTIPEDTRSHIDNPGLVDDLDLNYKHARESNVMKKCFDLIAKSDAILVLNYPRSGIKGYIGASSLMEIGLAYHLNKKIFLLHKIPKAQDVRWAHEIEVINPIIINGNLTKIDI